jgi:lambda repressor-like predicted transcriptional regulator
MSDANHRVGFVCARYACTERSTTDTPAGAMCADHREPLMFQVQLRRTLVHARGGIPLLVPWALVAPHDRQARTNHGGQTLARLSERGGLGPDELVAVLQDRDWRPMDEGVALDIIATAVREHAARAA